MQLAVEVAGVAAERATCVDHALPIYNPTQKLKMPGMHFKCVFHFMPKSCLVQNGTRTTRLMYFVIPLGQTSAAHLLCVFVVLQTGPQGVTAKGNKCKKRLTAARAHSLAEPGQAHAGNHCARNSDKESSLAGLGATASAWQNASEVQHP